MSTRPVKEVLSSYYNLNEKLQAELDKEKKANIELRAILLRTISAMDTLVECIGDIGDNLAIRKGAMPRPNEQAPQNNGSIDNFITNRGTSQHV